MRENEFSIVGKTAVMIGFIWLSVAAAANVIQGNVPYPQAFAITLVGFVLFLCAKLSLLRQGRLVSFGPGLMSPAMKNIYRGGYWVMIVGAMATFSS